MEIKDFNPKLSDDVMVEFVRTTDHSDYAIPENLTVDNERRLTSSYLDIKVKGNRKLVPTENMISKESGVTTITLTYKSGERKKQSTLNKEIVEQVIEQAKSVSPTSVALIENKLGDFLTHTETIKQNLTNYFHTLDLDSLYNFVLGLSEKVIVPKKNEGLRSFIDYLFESDAELLQKYAVMWYNWHKTYLTDREFDLQRWYYINAYLETKKEEQLSDVESIIILMQLDHANVKDEWGENWRDLVTQTDFENCEWEVYAKWLELDKLLYVKEYPVSYSEYPEYFRGDLKPDQILEGYNDTDTFHIVTINDKEALQAFADKFKFPLDVAEKIVADYAGSRQRIERVTNQLRYAKKVDIYKDNSPFKEMLYDLYKSSTYEEVDAETYYDHYMKKD